MFIVLRLFCLSYFIVSTMVCADESGRDESLKIAKRLEIKEDTQLLMGLQTRLLKPYLFQPKQKIVATRVDISVIMTAYLSYQEAAHDVALLQIVLDQKNVTIKRLILLKESKLLASRRWSIAQSKLRQTQLKLKYAKQKQQHLILNFKRQWGVILTKWFLTKNYQNFQHLLSGQQQLYRLYLPETFIHPPKLIEIFSVKVPEKKYSVTWFSYAPVQNFEHALGQGVFYLSEHNAITHSARLIAEVPMQTDAISGLRIPSSALIWHLGHAFVYLQDEETLFKRVSLAGGQRINDKDYFMPVGLLKSTDRLVTVGAQMLLSEEFRGQIQAEDDD